MNILHCTSFEQDADEVLLSTGQNRHHIIGHSHLPDSVDNRALSKDLPKPLSLSLSSTDPRQLPIA